jgi:hypothetical protein
MRHLKFFCSIFALSLLISSCNSPATKTDGETDKDTTAKPLPLASLFRSTLPLPLVIDSIFLMKQEFGDSIGTNEMKQLAANLLRPDESGGLEYELSDFYKIDSIKASGTYAAWCETLDIGMTKFSSAEALGKVKLNDNTDLLVWTLRQSSYEACPWSNLTSVYYTLVHNNTIGQTSLIGENFGAGDPPSSMHRDVYGKINADGSVVLDWREEHDDMDTTFSELEKRAYHLQIQDGKVALVKEIKEKPVAVPHPKDQE